MTTIIPGFVSHARHKGYPTSLGIRKIKKVTANTQAVTPSDFNADQKVDFQDFLLFAAHYGTVQNQDRYSAQFDLDKNGEIGFSDFLIFVQTFGT